LEKGYDYVTQGPVKILWFSEDSQKKIEEENRTIKSIKMSFS